MHQRMDVDECDGAGDTTTKIVELFEPWRREFGLPLLSSCLALRYLHIVLLDVGDVNLRPMLEFPVLQTLEVRTRTDIFAQYFASLPSLVHLTVVYGRIDEGSRLQSFHFGGDESPQSAWPVMPQLRTLTVDHVDVADLIPVLQTSPLLWGIHAHGNWGFEDLVECLLKPESPDQTYVPLLHLRHLRLWPVALGSDDFALNIYGGIEIDDLVPLVIKLLRARPSLLLEIGTCDEEHYLAHCEDDGVSWLSPLSRAHCKELLASDVQRRVSIPEIEEYDEDTYTEARYGNPPLRNLYEAMGEQIGRS